jgi:hypothetical protein
MTFYIAIELKTAQKLSDNEIFFLVDLYYSGDGFLMHELKWSG